MGLTLCSKLRIIVYVSCYMYINILNEITETCTSCGFRENMIQVAKSEVKMGDKDENREFFRDREHEPLSFKFKLIHESFAAMINRRLREEDMTFSQLILMFYLWENRAKKITQKDISEAMHIKHPTAIGLLKRLEEKEMVKVVVDPDNRKFRNIALTEKGVMFIENDRKRKRHTDEYMVNGFSEDEILQLRNLLDRVYDNMKVMESEES